MRPLLLCLLVGCVASDPTPGETTSALFGDDCWDINCPGNSNILGGIGPYELSLSGTPSSRGFWFDHASITRQQGAGPIHHIKNFQVLGGTVHGNDIDDGNKPITGDEIDGLRIPVYFNGTSRHPAQRYVLRVIRREDVEYYDGAIAPVDGYYIAYKKVDGDGNEPTDANGMPIEPWKDLCPYVEYDAGPGVSGSTWAVFWKGDRYDPVTGKILETDVQDGDWFNLGCAGDASVKMVRAKASAVTATGIPRSVKDATLNMFTAKYCPGSPRRYTHVGVRIRWDDKTVPSVLPLGYQTEAVWNPDGAVCLSAQRSIKDGIADCLDECTPDQKINWSQYGDLRSGVPLVLSLPK
jgi:hypothetical protein